MTIQNCMDLVDAMMPNQLRSLVKLRLLGEIEGKVKVELYGEDPDELIPFDEDTPTGTELCVPHPYDQLYLLYMMSMMDYLNGDAARYENGAAMFNLAYQNYGKWLKRKGV